jgi:hypothetical protein
MADRRRSEACDLSGEAVNGAITITTADAACMRNLKGYVVEDWMEAHMPLQCMAVMMGALLGATHPVLAVYTNFLRKYNAMEPRLRREFELVSGAKLNPLIWYPHAIAMVKLAARPNMAVAPIVHCQIFAPGCARLSSRTI